MPIRSNTVTVAVLGVLMFPILFGVFVLLLLAGFMIGNIDMARRGKTRKSLIKGSLVIC